MRRIADTLGVGHILEGSVRKSGDSIWITAQVIDGLTGFHRWSETYVAAPTAGNLRAVQSDVARDVAVALALNFRPDRDTLPDAPSENSYDAYLEGRSFLRRVQTELADYESMRHDVLRSIDRFRKVVSGDPD